MSQQQEQEQPTRLCGWFCAMSGPDRAVFLTRFSWLAATAISFIGLLPAGWQLVKYAAADAAVTAHYGLWKIEYYGQRNYVSNYLDWSAVQPEDSMAYARIQGVRACVVLGLAALAVQFLASLRLWCAKDVNVRRRFTIMCTLMAALDFAFTALALLLWKTIPRDAFLTFCSSQSCVRMPDAPGAAAMTVYYSWGFYIVKGALAFPGLVALVYLCTGFSYSGDAQSEARQQKSREAAAAGKDLKRRLSSKKVSSTGASSPKAGGGGGGDGGGPKRQGGKGSSKKWHEEEGDGAEAIAGEEDERGAAGAGGDEETGHAGARVMADEEEEEDPFPPKKKGGAAAAAAAVSSSPKGAGSSKGKGGFDRQAPVTFVSGASGNPNPSWLTG